MRRVTDLEKFALEQIWWPFQGMHPATEWGVRLTASPLSLEETAAELSKDTEWSRAVLSRLRRVGVSFPAYVQHPLVDAVRTLTNPGGSNG